MILVSVVCTSGLYLYLPALINCHPSQNAIPCGIRNTAILAEIVIIISFAMAGCGLSCFVFLIRKSENNPKYHFVNLLFFVKSIEIGGLIYCEVCVLIFPYMAPKANENWDIPLSPIILGCVIPLITLAEFYFLHVVVVGFKEGARNSCRERMWTTPRRLQDKEDYELNLHTIERY